MVGIVLDCREVIPKWANRGSDDDLGDATFVRKLPHAYKPIEIRVLGSLAKMSRNGVDIAAYRNEEVGAIEDRRIILAGRIERDAELPGDLVSHLQGKITVTRRDLPHFDTEVGYSTRIILRPSSKVVNIRRRICLADQFRRSANDGFAAIVVQATYAIVRNIKLQDVLSYSLATPYSTSVETIVSARRSHVFSRKKEERDLSVYLGGNPLFSRSAIRATSSSVDS